MLENIRENSQGLIAKVILGFVILSFAIAGIGSYTNSVDTSVAEVNGEKISQQAFEKAYQTQRRRMEQQFGDMFNTLTADSSYLANFRNGVLDNLINEKLLDQNADDLAIRISNERLKKAIREMPEFQVDGVFDNNRYLAIINQAGFFQSSDFRDYLRVEMIRRQLSQTIVSSEFNLPYQETLLAQLQGQQRDIRFAVIAAEQFNAGIELTDDEVNNYYLENQAQFETQEQVRVNYITLDVADIAKGVMVTDDDIAQYYQDNIATFTQAEQRRVSHILVEFGDDESAAKAKAQSVLARLNQGEDFAVLAKEFSADTFSGENGGDLAWIERGVMDEAFDEAAFSLSAVGGLSELVKTSFGFHIIKLTELKAEKIKAFAEVQDELRVKVAQEKAQEKFFELQQEMARISFEFPDNLEDAAKAVGVKIQSSAWLTRQGNEAPFNSPKAIDSIFSEVVLVEKVNSDVIEAGDDKVIVVHLNEYQPATVKPLAQVKDQISATLIASKATTAAQSKADELLTQLKAGTDISASLTAVNSAFVSKAEVSRNAMDLDPAISKETFMLPHPVEGKVMASTVTLGNGDLAIVELQTVKQAQHPVNPNLAKQQTSQLAQSAYQSYIDALKTEAKISRRALQALATQN